MSRQNSFEYALSPCTLLHHAYNTPSVPGWPYQRLVTAVKQDFDMHNTARLLCGVLYNTYNSVHRHIVGFSTTRRACTLSMTAV